MGVAGCGNPTHLEDKAHTLHVGNMVEPLTLDPHKAAGVAENRIISELLMGLITEDRQGRPIPGVAEEWNTSNDGLVWTFKLRASTWSDGVPVTAHDFVYAWQQILTKKPLSEYASILYFIKNAEQISGGQIKDVGQLGVKAYDDQTLIVTLEHPTPYLLGLLAHYSSFPIPKHIVEKFGDDWVKPDHYVANGPFKLVQWQPNEFVQITRNPKFWDNENVCLNKIFYYPTIDKGGALEKIKSGEIDVATEFVGSDLSNITKVLPGYARVHGYTGVVFASFNTRAGPLGDARVRGALSMSVDRQHVTRDIFKSGQQPAYSLVPPGVANYETGVSKLDFQGQSITTRRARARALLQEAGFGPNKPLTFKFSYREHADNNTMAAAFARDWGEIAPWVDVTLVPMEAQRQYSQMNSGAYEVGETGWIADFNDAKNFNFLFETRTKGLNYGNFSNAEFDNLMAAADKEKDTNKRKLFMQQAEAVLMREHALMPLWFVTSRNLVNPRVTGWEDNAVDIHRARYLCTTEALAQNQ